VNRTNVLHLIASNFVGGPEKQILTHCRHVDAARFHLMAGSFLESGRPNAFLDDARKAGLPTVGIAQAFPLDLRLPGRLRRELRQERIHVLVTHGYKANIVGDRARRRTGIPQVMYVRGWTAEDAKVKFYNRLERPFLRRADRVVTVAEAKRREIETLGVPSARIRVVVNAVEAAPPVTPAASLRETYGIPVSTPLLVAAGRLSPEKGHLDLVEAMGALWRAGSDAACVIFGEGPLEASIRRRLAEASPPLKIFLAGFHRGWKDHLGEADLLVNPSRSEVMPNVVLESMARGCPVAATDVGGVREVIEDGVTGYLAPPADPGALAEVLRRALGETHRRRDMGEAARRLVLERFSFDEQARRLQALYEELRSETRAGGA